MALSITNRGTFTHNTAGTSFTCAVTSNCTAGALIALWVSADNSSSGGSSNDINSVTDTLNNTWTKQVGPVFDNGAASAGVQGAWFTTTQNGGTIQTTTTITVNIGSSCTAKSGSFTEINKAAGRVVQVRTSGAKSAGATGTAATSGATGTVNIGEVLLSGFCIEAGTTQTCTGDSDTTNGTWSTLQYAEIGSTTSGNCSATQGKLQTTANSTQTHDVTLGISSDYHEAWIIVQEIALLTAESGNVPITGTAATLQLTREVAADSGNVPITGTAATVGRKLTLTASSGSVPITGTDATLTYNEGGGATTLTAEPGSVPISGTAATLKVNRKVDAQPGSVPISGTAATLKVNHRVSADAGAVPITGTNATLARRTTLVADAGSVPITGTSATLRVNRAVQAQNANVAITGTAAALKYNHRVSASSGSVPITGTDVTLARRTAMTASPGSVPIGGTDATFRVNRRVQAQSANVPITGTAATLTYITAGGEPAYGDSGVVVASSRTAAVVTSTNTGVVVGSGNSGVIVSP